MSATRTPIQVGPKLTIDEALRLIPPLQAKLYRLVRMQGRKLEGIAFREARGIDYTRYHELAIQLRRADRNLDRIAMGQKPQTDAQVDEAEIAEQMRSRRAEREQLEDRISVLDAEISSLEAQGYWRTRR